jgi:uncharacterized protein
MQSDHKSFFSKDVERFDECVDFIKYYSSKLIDTPLQIHFFGGEPLMYFDKIKKLVEALNGSNVVFSMITNGSLIDETILQFINDYNIRVCISWDGRNTVYSRNVDVFETNKKNIFAITDGFSVSGVINHGMYPKEFFEDVENLEKELLSVRDDIDNIHFGFNLDCLYNLGHTNEVYDIDFERLSSEMNEIVYNFMYDSDKNTKFANIYVNDMIDSLRNAEEETNFISMCNNGLVTLNLDLCGNLHMCHDVSDRCLGTIYSTVDEYMSNYHKFNNVAPEFYKQYCFQCDVRHLCRGGCSLLSEEERKNFYCHQRKILYKPIIDELLKLSVD